MHLPNEMRPGLISVVTPSRHNPDGLRRSWTSCRDLSVQPTKLEFIVAYDVDDPITFETAREFDIERWIGYPAPTGDLKIYYTTLLTETSGEWAWLSSDKAEVLTDGWDDVVREQVPGIYDVGGYVLVHRDFMQDLDAPRLPAPFEIVKHT